MAERQIPTPEGGVAFSNDLPGAVVFILLFALPVPFAVFRFARPKSRTWLLAAPTFLVVERVAVLSLRAAQSRNEALRFNHVALSYLQWSYTQAPVLLAFPVFALLRVALVQHTNPSDEMDDLHPACIQSPNNPIRRRRIRWLFGLCDLVLLGLTGMNMAQAVLFKQTLDSDGAVSTDTVIILRVTSYAVTVALVLLTFIVTIVCRKRGIFYPLQHADTIMNMLYFLVVTCAFRLAGAGNVIPRLDWTGRHSRQSTFNKLAFYVVQLLVEFALSALLLMGEVRENFQTGMFGDWRLFDGQRSPLSFHRNRSTVSTSPEHGDVSSYLIEVNPRPQ